MWRCWLACAAHADAQHRDAHLCGHVPCGICAGVSLQHLQVTVRAESGQVAIEWLAAAGNCVLQEAGSVSASAAWTTVPVTPQLSDGIYRVAVPMVAGSKSYRLRCVQ